MQGRNDVRDARQEADMRMPAAVQRSKRFSLEAELEVRSWLGGESVLELWMPPTAPLIVCRATHPLGTLRIPTSCSA